MPPSRARPGRKKPASKRTRAKKPRAPKKKKTRPPRWPAVRRWLLTRALLTAVGLVLGLGASSAWWAAARAQVLRWLDDPPPIAEGRIWSAPIEVVAGTPLGPAELGRDLAGAGYARVGSVTGPGQFSESADRVVVWTAQGEVAGRTLTAGRAEVDFGGGRVRSTVPRAGLTLRPTVLARTGHADAHRDPVDLAALPPHLPDAVLSMEDARFFQHHGVDPMGVARALWRNLATGARQGGSTLTQQLAKNLFLTPERTLRRKVREAFLAAALESELDKDALLGLYLREVYLGHDQGAPIVGVEQAARAWFGTTAAALDLGQAATIAGVIASPNRWSPLRDAEAARVRRDVALGRMVAAGRITEDQAAAARAQPLATAPNAHAGAIAPWVVEPAVAGVERALGPGVLADGGLQVHTTIQPHLQPAARRAVEQGLAAVDPSGSAQGSLVAVSVRDGRVLAVVGGRDYPNSSFHRAAHAWRQGGSVVKPLTVLAAMNDDPTLGPLDRVVDEPITVPWEGSTWSPRNYDGDYRGRITLRRAIADSRNVPAVELAQRVGFERLQAVYRAAGLSRADDGQVLHRAEPTGVPLAHRRTAQRATRVLEAVIEEGTGRAVRDYGLQGPLAGKTGTTDDYRDAWFAGFDGTISAAVWVGHDRGTLGLSGSKAALPLWSRFMAAAGPTPLASGASTPVVVCTETGQPAARECPGTRTVEVHSDDVRTQPCDVHGEPEARRGLTGWLSRLFGRKRGR